ncbi:vWA domain-containing protein [Acidipropionibacterium timonense]|uniref:vWA domain-containing protein n=1 Tax=Acidipropionibacterium timonense TaxID=2161818 RepID=UPI001031BAE0|nr:VWA domain-containing protein [Acidipropionibacterium timonense]
MTRRVPAATVAATLLALTTAALPGLVTAGTARAEGPVTAQQPVVVVTDFSGSMNTKDADSAGTTRIAAATAAVKHLLSASPRGASLGLVVYGARNDSCADIQTLNPVGSFDAARLSATVDSLAAKGNTPIGPALEHAAADLKGVTGPKAIVLVSDGEPNCTPPDPCEVARKLSHQGVDLTVHTIGLRIRNNPAAQRTLKCIAAATGGRYTDVNDAKGLDEALTFQTTRALAGYASSGTRVEGGPTVTAAEPLVAGQYVVKLPSGTELDRKELDQDHPNRRFFAVPQHEGWEAVVTATLVPPPLTSGAQARTTRNLDLHETGPSTQYCTSNVDRRFQSGYLDTTDLEAVLTLKPDDGTHCLDAQGRRVISVTRHGEGWADKDLDVELTVSYRRTTSDATTTDPGKAPAAKETSARTVAGGTSFTDATVLAPGQTIADDVNGQERRYFAVPVEYGQNLRVRMHLATNQKSPGSSAVAVSPYNALRQRLTFSGTEHRDGSHALSIVTSGGGDVADATLRYPVTPERLTSSDPQEQVFGVPGMVYLVVGRSWNGKDGVPPQRFTLTPTVWGTPVAAQDAVITTAEQYETMFTPQTPAPAPSGSSSASTTPAASTSRAPASSSPTPATSPSPQGFLTTTRLVVAGVVVAVLATGGTVGAIVLRRRRSR